MQYDAVDSYQGKPAPSQKANKGQARCVRDLLLTPRESDTRSVVAGDAAGGRGRESSMVVVSPGATVSGVASHEHASLGESAAVSASIARYNRAAERTLTLSNFLGIVAVGLFVLIAVAWLLGLLPGSVRLF
jgi:hypothetical protein